MSYKVDSLTRRSFDGDVKACHARVSARYTLRGMFEAVAPTSYSYGSVSGYDARVLVDLRNLLPGEDSEDKSALDLVVSRYEVEAIEPDEASLSPAERDRMRHDVAARIPADAKGRTYISMGDTLVRARIIGAEDVPWCDGLVGVEDFDRHEGMFMLPLASPVTLRLDGDDEHEATTVTMPAGMVALQSWSALEDWAKSNLADEVKLDYNFDKYLVSRDKLIEPLTLAVNGLALRLNQCLTREERTCGLSEQRPLRTPQAPAPETQRQAVPQATAQPATQDPRTPIGGHDFGSGAGGLVNFASFGQ